MGRVGCGDQGWIPGHHPEAMAVVRFKVMFLDQGDGGGKKKWMELGSRTNKTWVERNGKAQVQPAPTEGRLRQQQTQGQWGAGH